MKKIFLFSALCAAFPLSAQIEVGFMDASSLDLGSKPVLAEETVLAETASVKMTWANEGESSAQNCDFNGIKNIIVNGQNVQLVPGIGGAVNPAGVDINVGPTKGGVQYHFQVKKDGWLIIPSKISSNKNFYAYEGTFEGQMKLMAYTLGMGIYSGDYPELEYGVYSLPADEYDYFDMGAANADDYLFGGTAIAWPIRIFTKNVEAGSAGNGTGVVMFPVYAEGADYWVFATGSKMNTCGFVFVPGAEKPAVTLYGQQTDEEGNLKNVRHFAVSGSLQDKDANVAEMAAEFDANAPVYNALGVRVNADAKGLLIQNGKKFIRK